MTTAPERILWVFTTDLRWVGADPAEPPPGTLEAKVARCLLGAGSAWRGKPWSLERRLQRARMLMHAHLGDARPWSARGRERWQYVREEWTWLLQSSDARQALVGLLAGEGLAGIDGALGSVLDRLRESLFPILVLRTAVLAAVPDQFAPTGPLDEVVSWTVPMVQAAQLARPYEILLHLMHGRIPTAEVDISVHRILKETADPSARHRLLSAYAQAHLEALKGNPGASAWLVERAEKLQQIQGRDPHLMLATVAAVYHVAASTKAPLDERNARQACLRLARAQALDPINPHASEQLKRVGELLKEVQTRSTDRRLPPASQRIMREIATALEAGLSDANQFLAGAEAATLVDRHRRAMLVEIAERLGIAGDLDERERVASSVVGALETAAEDVGRLEAPSAAAVYQAGRTLLEASVVTPLPWERIQRALEAAKRPGGWVLAFTLEEPAAPDLEAMARALQASCATTGGTPPHRGTRAAAWLWSRRDWPVKAAAAGSVALALSLSAVRGAEAARSRALQRHYDQVLGDVAAGRDPDTRTAAASFLSRVPSADPRAPQVADYYRSATLRELFRLRTAGDRAGVARVLAEYRALAPRLETAGTQSGSSHHGGDQS